jgi:hypothetical protein
LGGLKKGTRPNTQTKDAKKRKSEQWTQSEIILLRQVKENLKAKIANRYAAKKECKA